MILQNDEKKRGWFAPKGSGYGVRPQTWQGWLLVLIPTAIVLIVAAMVH
jgi:hypothetical protein